MLRIFCLLMLCFLALAARAQEVPANPEQPTMAVPADTTYKPLSQLPDSVKSATDTTRVLPFTKRFLRLAASEQDRKILKKYNYKKEHADSVGAVFTVRDLVMQLQEEAYLTASADTIYGVADTIVAYIYVGDLVRWAHLKPGNVSEALIMKAGFRERFYRNKPLRPKEFIKLQNRLLDFAENSGYPFAAVKLDSILLGPDQTISAKLVLEPGPLVTFDSVQIIGNTKTKTKFLARHLQITSGQVYSQQRVRASDRLVRQLPYITSTRAPEVRFAGHKARVYYFLDDKKANQLDGILGFLPNPITNKLMLTGELNGVLRNITGTGKQISLQWRKTGVESQLLDVGYVHPNLFGSPIEFDFNFNLFKQDTTFLNLEPKFQFSYYTTRFGKVGFFFQLRSSRLLYTPDTTRSALPDFASSNLQSYGVSHTWNNLNDVFFPKSGWRTNVVAAIGTKRIRSLTTEQAREIPASSAQIRLQAQAERYTRITRASTLLTNVRWSGMFNDHLFLTDMFRVGGLTTLRGFNELEFYASNFAIATAEYRFFTGQDSYLLAFFDQGYVENSLQERQIKDYPYGFGAGLSFSTGAGIFSFIYSVGKSEALGQTINFSQARIHFGITNRF